MDFPPISPEFIPGRATNEANNTTTIALDAQNLSYTLHRVTPKSGTIAIVTTLS
ncbi:MAG: hypothetical protein RBJ76_15215 [Stenomitos frigidus ULC029]